MNETPLGRQNQSPAAMSPREVYRRDVAALSAEAWSPTRIAGEYGLAQRHAWTGWERYETYKPLADERLLALEALERATGFRRVTPDTAADFQRRKLAGQVSSEEQAVEDARRDHATADIVATSARSRAESAQQRAQLIHDAYPDVVHGVLENQPLK